ncbi:hypothetical protein KAU11_07205 [Candidatus Babeliales bacterium]|nr:hypothetical protein [Candidatus Babeliales bacterium]
MAKKVGRPQKTLNDLPSNWEEIIIDLKTKGGSDTECKAELNISNDLWEALIAREPKFSETIKRGALLCEAWWVKAGREGIYQTSGGKTEHSNLNPVLWYMNMKNRFGWRDKHDIAHSGDMSITVEIDGKTTNS